MHRTEKEKTSKRGNIVFERKDGERVNLESRDVARNGLHGGDRRMSGILHGNICISKEKGRERKEEGIV